MYSVSFVTAQTLKISSIFKTERAEPRTVLKEE
jgi:hypothetical protein